MTVEDIQSSPMIKIGLESKGLTDSEILEVITTYALEASICCKTIPDIIEYLYARAGDVASCKLYDSKYTSDTELSQLQLKWLGEYSANHLSSANKSKLLNYLPTTQFIKSKDMDFADRYLANPTSLYHGNDKEITVPKYGKGKLNTDFGQGFYTAPDLEMTRKWAWTDYYSGSKRYVHSYTLDLSDLEVLNLTRLDIKCWLSLLFKYRVKLSESKKSDDIGYERAIEFTNKFTIDDNGFDVIIGYRADDSFFTYIYDFLAGSISLELLEHVMHLGFLGIQVFIKSQQAFEHLTYNKEDDSLVDKSYAGKYKFIVEQANAQYFALQRKSSTTQGTFILDLLRGDSFGSV